MMRLSLIIPLLGAALAAVAVYSPDAFSSLISPMTCTEISIPVTISAQNLVIPGNDDGSYSTTPVEGTYNISARYCEPLLKIHKHALQVLVHGITYTRDYWSGALPPGQSYQGSTYSWISYAAFQGYPTLSIDRLGNGQSSHPDPIGEVQINAEVETIHQVILKARNGTLFAQPGRKFKKIIYVGHSFGSLLGNKLTTAYPSDADVAILTGWTPMYTSIVKTLLYPALGAAALVEPQRYGTLNPFYLEINSSSLFQLLFYHPNNYDTKLMDLDFSTRGTVTLGEFVSSGVQHPVPAPAFVGSVMFIIGQYDNAFCPETEAGANCGTGWTQNVTSIAKGLYPDAKAVSAYSIPDVGHCWNYHFRAQEGFKIVHGWLKEHLY